MVAVRDHLDQLGDCEVVVVTFAEPRRALAFRRHFDVPFSYLCDEDRRAYDAFGFGRGTWWDVWGAATLRKYGRLLLAGRLPKPPRDDTRQLGGDVVVDARGRVSYLRRARGPADRPPIDEVVAAVEAAR